MKGIRNEIIRDQAETLRKRTPIRERSLKGITRVMSFTSGKGGVGKTNSVVNVALSLAKLGRRVLLLDADLGLANVDVLLGITPARTIQDVLAGHASLEEIIIEGPEGISIIPASSGVESICHLDTHQKMLLLNGVEEVAASYDYLLIDTAAGISSEVMYFNSASSEIVCVITNEPTSLTDAYALIKVLSQSYGEKGISVVVNNVPSEAEALSAYKKLSRSVERFLHMKLEYLGWIPTDVSVGEAVRRQRALSEEFPSSAAARSIAGITERIDERFLSNRVKGGMQFFFRQLLGQEELGGSL